MTCCWEQDDVPIGGTRGVWIGATDGGTMPQTVGGHIGGKSMELLQIGCISPPTQRQTHAASDFPAKPTINATANRKRIWGTFLNLWRFRYRAR